MTETTPPSTALAVATPTLSERLARAYIERRFRTAEAALLVGITVEAASAIIARDPDFPAHVERLAVQGAAALQVAGIRETREIVADTMRRQWSDYVAECARIKQEPDWIAFHTLRLNAARLNLDMVLKLSPRPPKAAPNARPRGRKQGAIAVAATVISST